MWNNGGSFVRYPLPEIILYADTAQSGMSSVPARIDNLHDYPRSAKSSTSGSQRRTSGYFIYPPTRSVLSAVEFQKLPDGDASARAAGSMLCKYQRLFSTPQLD